MFKAPFGKKSIKVLNNIIETLFETLKLKFLGQAYAKGKGNKAIVISASSKPELTLTGIYQQAAIEESARPDPEVLSNLLAVAEGYLDSQKERTKSVILNKINSSISSQNPKAVIMTELAQVWAKTSADIIKIAENETNTAKNIGILEGIVKVNASMGIDDPVVAMIGPLDEGTCDECVRVLWLPDRITPRVFKLSEISSNGYHKRGTDVPSMSGCHPGCRSTITTVLKGYGFKGGNIAFISFDHDEYKTQRP